MTNKNLIIGICLVIAVVLVGYFFSPVSSVPTLNSNDNLDPNPRNVTLSGRYVCLPHLDTTSPQTKECAFGLLTDDGVYYAVNFGQFGNSMEQFQSGEHITAEGFVVIKEALSTDQWAKYNMKGIFTITKMIDPAPVQGQGKLNINVICDEAIIYMTFTDGESAERFVAECKQGKHPQVIEDYKIRMGLGSEVAI